MKNSMSDRGLCQRERWSRKGGKSTGRVCSCKHPGQGKSLWEVTFESKLKVISREPTSCLGDGRGEGAGRWSSKYEDPRWEQARQVLRNSFWKQSEWRGRAQVGEEPLILNKLTELAQAPKTRNKHGSAPKSYCRSSAGEETTGALGNAKASAGPQKGKEKENIFLFIGLFF